MTRYIYKICPSALWDEARKAGTFTGAGIDIQDGYIHFSTAAQTAQTLALHFTGQEGLMLIEVDSAMLDIKWEPSRGGQLFPHLYSALPLSCVRASWDLPVGDDGIHILPKLAE